MTEDIVMFLSPGERDERGQSPELPRSPGWHLNDNDLSVIDDLHATCIDWLQYAKDAQTARGMADVLAALEAIASGGSVTSTIEVSITRKPEDSDGMTATLTVSPSDIVLSVVEWVFTIPAQGHDHAWQKLAELTPSGSFDFDAIDRWQFMWDFATDGEKTELTVSSRDEWGM